MTFSSSTKPLATKPKLCALGRMSWLHFLSAGASEPRQSPPPNFPDSISSFSLAPRVSPYFGVTPNLDYVTQKNKVKSQGEEKWAASFLSTNDSFSVCLTILDGDPPAWPRCRPRGGIKTFQRDQLHEPGHRTEELSGFPRYYTLTYTLHMFVCTLKFCYIFIMWWKQGCLEVVRKIRNKCRFQLFLFLWSVFFI